MNTINASFHLHAPMAQPATAVQTGADLPAEVAGQPATYFWKEMIHVGNYVHPTRGYSLNVDRNRLSRWAKTGENMIAAGVPIPINCDHSDHARDVVGYVKQFKLDGDHLLGLCQFIGPDAALTAARNWVSVGINPDFTDGQARSWGEAIVHLALTPVPVVPAQGEFISASQNAEGNDTLVLSTDAPPADPPPTCDPPAEEAEETDDAELTDSVVCTAEQLELLRQLIPDAADLSPQDCITRLIQYLQDESDDDDEQKDSTDEVDLQAELSAARRQITELSSRLPPILSTESQAAMIEAATAKFDAAVDRGGISPTARDRLIAVLVQGGDGKANVFALSRMSSAAGDRALALSVADILLDNPPIATGEKTGLQSLTRSVPGEESSGIDQLRLYMTKVASVSG